MKAIDMEEMTHFGDQGKIMRDAIYYQIEWVVFNVLWKLFDDLNEDDVYDRLHVELYYE